MQHEEENTQIQCVRWFNLAYPRLALLLHHSPNGGRRTIREAARFKAMGTRAGYPDIQLNFPNARFHGLFIEMKSKIGQQSQHQKRMQQALQWAGYDYQIARSFDDFRSIITKYLAPNEKK